MMKVAIHQPHYFPWIGYFDKMAKVDSFILLDRVQFEKGSNMYRNRICDETGEIRYLTVSADKHGFLEKEYREIPITETPPWRTKQINQIKRAYGQSIYFDEVWQKVSIIFQSEERNLCDLVCNSIFIIKDLLEIRTKLILQTELNYDENTKKNDLVLELCKAISANAYLSGNGARKYTNEKSFTDNDINLKYQNLIQSSYIQNSEEFIPGLSILDVLFNCGIDETKKMFWKNVALGNEFND